MEPPLNGATKYETPDYIYLFGGQGPDNITTRAIYRFKRGAPNELQRVGTMKDFRVDPFVMKVGNYLFILGGSEHASLEVLDDKTFSQVEGLEARAMAFLDHLSCYTTDLKIQNCSSC